MFDKILIANRGEIACRIARTCRRLGVAVAGVHSSADADALHVQEIGESIAIGGAAASDSYLRIDAVIDAAKATGAQAIHPGFGFIGSLAIGFCMFRHVERLNAYRERLEREADPNLAFGQIPNPFLQNTFPAPNFQQPYSAPNFQQQHPAPNFQQQYPPQHPFPPQYPQHPQQPPPGYAPVPQYQQYPPPPQQQPVAPPPQNEQQPPAPDYQRWMPKHDDHNPQP